MVGKDAGCIIRPLFVGLVRDAAGWQTTTVMYVDAVIESIDDHDGGT